VDRKLSDSQGEQTVKEQHTLLIDNLVPSTPYIFNITAKFIDGNWGPKVMLKVETGIDGK